MNMCIHVYTHTCTYIYTHIYKHFLELCYMYVHVLYVYTCAVSTYKCMHICIHKENTKFPEMVQFQKYLVVDV